MAGHRTTRPDVTADQLRLLLRCARGAVVFYDEGIVFCGNERITGVKLDDLVDLMNAGLLLRLSHQAFELTSFGRIVAQELPVE